jgi:enolase
MAIIKDVQAREISDSRGNPTVEVDLWLDDGQMVRAAVPSGASTGKKEALELRDHDAKRFNGLGVLHGVANVNGPLRAFVLGQDPINQQDIDRGMIALDGTENKAKFGNAILGVSMAVLKAGALASQLPLNAMTKSAPTSCRFPS